MNIDDKTLKTLTEQNKKLNTLILDIAKVHTFNVKTEWRQIEYLSLRDSLIKNIDFLSNFPNIYYLDLYQNPIENYAPLMEVRTFGFLSFSSPESYLEKKIMCLHNINAITIKVEIKDRSNYQSFIFKNPNVLIMNNSIIEFNYKIFFLRLVQKWKYYCKKLYFQINGEKLETSKDKEIIAEMQEKDINKKFIVHKKENTTNSKIREIENFFEEFNTLMIKYYKNKKENLLNGNIYRLEKKKLLIINKTLFNIIKFNHNNEGLYKFMPNKKSNMNNNNLLSLSIHYPNLNINIFNQLTLPELKKITLSIILLNIFKIFSKDITLFLLTLIFMKTNYYKQNIKTVSKFDLMNQIKDFLNIKPLYIIALYFQIYDDFYKNIDKKNNNGIEKNLKMIQITNKVMDIANYLKLKNNDKDDFNGGIDFEIISDINCIKNIKEFHELLELNEHHNLHQIQKIQYLNKIIHSDASEINFFKSTTNKINNDADPNNQNIEENNKNDNNINNIKLKKSKINNFIKYFIRINVFDDLLNIIQYVYDFIIFNHLDKELEHDFSDDIQFLIAIKNNMFLFVSNKNQYKESFADKYFNKLQAESILANRFFFKNEKIRRVNQESNNVFLNQRHKIYHPNKKKLNSFSKVKTLKQQMIDQEIQLKTEFINNALNSFFVVKKEKSQNKNHIIGNSLPNCKTPDLFNSRNNLLFYKTMRYIKNNNNILPVTSNGKINSYFHKYTNHSSNKTLINNNDKRKYILNKLPNMQCNNLKMSYDILKPISNDKKLFLKTFTSPRTKKEALFIKSPNNNESRLSTGPNMRYLINNNGTKNGRFDDFVYSKKENKNYMDFSTTLSNKTNN